MTFNNGNQRFINQKGTPLVFVTLALILLLSACSGNQPGTPDSTVVQATSTFITLNTVAPTAGSPYSNHPSRQRQPIPQFQN